MPSILSRFFMSLVLSDDGWCRWNEAIKNGLKEGKDTLLFELPCWILVPIGWKPCATPFTCNAVDPVSFLYALGSLWWALVSIKRSHQESAEGMLPIVESYELLASPSGRWCHSIGVSRLLVCSFGRSFDWAPWILRFSVLLVQYWSPLGPWFDSRLPDSKMKGLFRYIARV